MMTIYFSGAYIDVKCITFVEISFIADQLSMDMFNYITVKGWQERNDEFIECYIEEEYM